MKGLIIKDLINLRSQGKIFALVILFWFVIALATKDGAFMGSMMMLIAVMMPISTIAFDERTKWDSFALTMPVSRRDIVAGKYVCTLIILTAAFVISLIGSAIQMISLSGAILTTLNFLAVGIVINDIMLPLMFKFGVEKGRIVFIAVVLLGAATATVAVNNDGLIGMIGAMSTMALSAVFMAAAAVCTFISFRLSISIYEAKEI